MWQRLNFFASNGGMSFVEQIFCLTNSLSYTSFFLQLWVNSICPSHTCPTLNVSYTSFDVYILVLHNICPTLNLSVTFLSYTQFFLNIICLHIQLHIICHTHPSHPCPTHNLSYTSVTSLSCTLFVLHIRHILVLHVSCPTHPSHPCPAHYLSYTSVTSLSCT